MVWNVETPEQWIDFPVLFGVNQQRDRRRLAGLRMFRDIEFEFRHVTNMLADFLAVHPGSD